MFISVGHPPPDAECLNTTVVVVLGMHRSGTSSAAGALARLGAAPPRRLIGPSADNEKGYWESKLILDLNDAILAAGDSDWKDWRKFDLDKVGALKANTLRVRARAVLTAEFGDVGLAVMKDPRMCRLMPFWSPVFEEARWSVRALLPIRSPLEVGWSLKRRDDIGPAYGCLLWLRHVLDAEAETRGMARAVLDWSEFLGNGRRALARANEHLGVTWPYGGEGALADIDQFVSADLRRQRASDDDLEAHPAINDMARRTYAAMMALVRDPRDGCALRTLDDLRAGFETAAAIFDIPMREERGGAHRIRSQAATEIARAHDIGERTGRAPGASRRAAPRFPWGRRLRATAAREAEHDNLEAVRNSPFFNSAHYLETNPDVRAIGIDPALHYILHGAREGRDPGPFFSTKAYLARYPDIAKANVNALVHYETHGRRENRVPAV